MNIENGPKQRDNSLVKLWPMWTECFSCADGHAWRQFEPGMPLCPVDLGNRESSRTMDNTHTHKHSEHDGSYKYLDRSSWHLALCFKIPFSGLGHSFSFLPPGAIYIFCLFYA